MPLLQTIETGFGDQFVSVLASADGLNAARNVDLQSSLYSVQKVFPPGLFAGTHTGGKARLLPRVRLAVAANSGQANIVCPAFMAGLFVVGDVLNVVFALESVADNKFVFADFALFKKVLQDIDVEG